VGTTPIDDHWGQDNMGGKTPHDAFVHGEEAIIQGFLAPLAQGFAGAFGLSDDCALITPEAGTELILKTDPVAEGVHFFADDAPEDIAWKALAVNVSDLAAKAATPIGYLMAISFPAPPAREWLSRFAAGLKSAQDCFGCHLVGGDTDRRPGPLSITITVFGSVTAGRMIRRGTAAPGDALFVSGTLGDAALGLALRKDARLSKRWNLSPAEADFLRRRYLRPSPRLGLASTLRQHAGAAMDLSDGLAKDLGRMAVASRCGARVNFCDLPLSEACRKVLNVEPALAQRVIAGGDDYEILAALPVGKARQFAASAQAAGQAVAQIGMMEKEAGIVIVGVDGKPIVSAVTGWDHF
jgi:thiamine-monophosphate kinase